MRPLQYLSVFRHRWPLVVIGVLVGLLAGGAFVVSVPDEYSSDATLFVAAGPPSGPTSAYDRAQVAQQRVPSYRELATDSRITSGVVRDLGLAESPGELSTRLEASSVADSLIIQIAVRDEDPARATAIVDDVAQRFVGLVRELEQPPNPVDPPEVALVLLRPASVPTAPDGPPVSSYLLLGGLLGLLLGAAAALARELSDRRIRADGVLADLTGAPTVGRLPAQDSGPERVEALRALRTALRHLPGLTTPSLLVVAGTGPDDGAAPTVAELAAGLAAVGESVLVVDADLRRPQLSGLLGLPSGPGLVEVLRGQVDVGTAVRQHHAYDVLVAGETDGESAELVASAAVPGMVARLPHRWDRVLVLGPPLLSVPDSAALAPHSDGVLLVVRWNRTTTDQVRRAVAGLRAVSATVRATVLTDVPPPRRTTPYGPDRPLAPAGSDEPTLVGPSSTPRR